MKSVSIRSAAKVRKTWTPTSLKLKMDALVTDLSLALDESQQPQYHKKRRGYKRRQRLTNSHSLSTLSNRIMSDDSSSSLNDFAHSQDNKSSIPHTDSDDIATPPERRMRTPHLTRHHMAPNLVESDSVNETFSSSRLQTRRKQKCKRMAMDIEVPSTSTVAMESPNRVSISLIRRKKPRSFDKESYGDVCGMKRKRGRDKSAEFESRRIESSRSKGVGHSCGGTSTNEERMDCGNTSNAGSSSDSDCGIHTCDEGREADDEQSDWFAEPGGVYGVGRVIPSVSSARKVQWWQDQHLQLSPSTQAFFKEKYEKMSLESQQACRLRFQKLRERLLRREIRAGRRRLQERKPGFSIISSVNDKVSRFLQDPDQVQLHLRPMGVRDRDQLEHLAELYSLSLHSDGDQGAPVLTKTRNTITTQGDSAPDNLSTNTLPLPQTSWKKCRRTPPLNNNQTEGSNESLESVINNDLSNSTEGSVRPPNPYAWTVGTDDPGYNSERLADSETDPLPSVSLGLQECTL